MKPKFGPKSYNLISFGLITESLRHVSWVNMLLWKLKIWRNKSNDDVNLSLLKGQSNGNWYQPEKAYGDWGKKGAEDKESIKLDVLENHFSLFFIQLLQIIDSGGSKYIPEFPDAFPLRWSFASFLCGWAGTTSANPGTKQQWWGTALESKPPWLCLCSVPWIICSGKLLTILGTSSLRKGACNEKLWPTASEELRHFLAENHGLSYFAIGLPALPSQFLG